VLAAVWLLTGPASAPAAGAGTFPPALSVLYIEANTGDSSGGHAGLKIGDRVFHYQYGNQGRLVLRRESWEEFRTFYNDLGNRVIHMARLEVPGRTRRRIRDHFTLALLQQDSRQARLRNARARVDLLRAVAEGRKLPDNLKGAGFFRRQNLGGGRPAARLKQAIAERLGPNFLARECRRLRHQLSRLPTSPETFVTWHERRSLLAALETIDHELGLDPEVLVKVPTRRGKPGLGPAERKRLVLCQQNFANSIIRLLGSQRPDRGFPLLLATARYLAAAASLKQNRLLLLDARPADAEVIDPLDQAGSREILELLAGQNRLKVAAQRRRLFSRDRKISEFAWCRLENAATRYAELQAAADGRRSMRVYPENAIPARPGRGPELKFSSPASVAAARLPAARRKLEQLESEYNRRFGYNLFTRNCVTELFATLVRALPPPTEANSGFNEAERKVMATISFIPWRMFTEVKNRLHPAAVTRLPSLRQRYLAALARREPAFFVYLKECNTVTSSLCRRGGGNEGFLLFTREAGPLRPLYGAINLAWSLPQAVCGLFSWPFDGGRELRKGGFGVLFSLPELFFINLRKGSFLLVPEPPGTG